MQLFKINRRERKVLIEWWAANTRGLCFLRKGLGMGSIMTSIASNPQTQGYADHMRNRYILCLKKDSDSIG